MAEINRSLEMASGLLYSELFGNLSHAFLERIHHGARSGKAGASSPWVNSSNCVPGEISSHCFTADGVTYLILGYLRDHIDVFSRSGNITVGMSSQHDISLFNGVERSRQILQEYGTQLRFEGVNFRSTNQSNNVSVRANSGQYTMRNSKGQYSAYCIIGTGSGFNPLEKLELRLRQDPRDLEVVTQTYADENVIRNTFEELVRYDAVFETMRDLYQQQKK